LDYSDLVRFRQAALILLALVAVASLVTIPAQPGIPNAPILSGAQVEPPILAILERSCSDCHSDATRYPWYSYVAPISWLISKDVERGRERLNFSRWNDYPLIRRMRSLSGIASQVKDGEMPLALYTWLHPNARLTAEEVNAIFNWTQAERARLIEGSTGNR
jgi:heme-binding protein